jgi:hypothetical protein
MWILDCNPARLRRMWRANAFVRQVARGTNRLAEETAQVNCEIRWSLEDAAGAPLVKKTTRRRSLGKEKNHNPIRAAKTHIPACASRRSSEGFRMRAMLLIIELRNLQTTRSAIMFWNQVLAVETVLDLVPLCLEQDT